MQAQEFFDGVDFDPDTPTNLYGSVFHYSLDYSRAKPGAEWSTIGVTLNRFKYPGDFRLNSTNTNHPLQQVVDYMGHHFLILGDGYHLAIYRFNPRTDGEIAIPAVLFDDTTAPYPIPAPGSTSLSLPAGWKLWTDTNGDGQVQPSEWSTNSNPIPLTLFWGSWVDANLDIRQIVQAKATSYLVTIPMQRLNASGVPIYDFSKITKVALPTLPGGEVWNASGYAAARVQYIEAEDALYISGNTSVHADVPGDGGIGGVLVRFNHWSRGKPCLAWEYPLAEPLLPAANIDKKTDLYDKPIAIRVADDYVFIQYLETYHMRVLDAHTGRILPGILAPDEKVVGDMSHIWVDWKQGVHVIRLTSGEYEVLVEDDIYDKQILYRWTPSRRIRTE